ncbi:hypothetical protein [Umezawaea beigongshangensis]|uniref:hypothetical protein n=1 Tax=Umezawaea beigongshangensis TaxID=2780383 RepID=UPI0018F12F38|nr:hypothetical protein [Umezawaea beigongshangensis]
MFEEAPQERPKRRTRSVVLLSFGGVVVATLFATFASMLAAENERATEPQKKQPEAGQESPPRTETSLVISPDGTTSTVVLTVSTSPRDRSVPVSGDQPPRAGDGPSDGEHQHQQHEHEDEQQEQHEQRPQEQAEEERPAPPVTAVPSSPPSTATTSQLPSTSPVAEPTTTTLPPAQTTTS